MFAHASIILPKDATAPRTETEPQRSSAGFDLPGADFPIGKYLATRPSCFFCVPTFHFFLLLFNTNRKKHDTLPMAFSGANEQV
jgi:hypothetical protein